MHEAKGTGLSEGAGDKTVLDDYDSFEERAARQQIRTIMRALYPSAEFTYRGARVVFKVMDREVTAVDYLRELRTMSTTGMEQRRLESVVSGYVDTDAAGVYHPRFDYDAWLKTRLIGEEKPVRIPAHSGLHDFTVGGVWERSSR